MEPVISCDSMSRRPGPSPAPNAPIWQDILAHAITGELIAAMNYTSLSEICDDPEEIADALETRRGNGGMQLGLPPRAARSAWTFRITSTRSIGSGCAMHFCAALQSAILSAA
jgi:hypothetical protein